MRRLAATLTATMALGLCPAPAFAAQSPDRDCEGPVVVCERGRGAVLIADGKPARVVTDPGDWPGVSRAAQDLQRDLTRVAGGQPPDEDAPVVLVGTLGRNATIDRLVAEGRLDVSGVAGVWEGFAQQVIDRPMPGVDRALVIAGADKRGAIFGAYDLSERIGVSPWTWWADVPVPTRANLSVTAGRRADAPSVRYRGIFLNDEAPSLTNWANQTHSGFNHGFYERVFELILRLKGNFLWPAMWGKAFSDDDPINPILADAYGVVIGTSHHEPLARAHIEWERHGDGAWDWRRNPAGLTDFWRGGMARRGETESLVTIGMRGDGDEAMTEGTAIPLLEDIVASQRRIIAETTGRPAEQTPQVWALYKEVQDYYDQGMQVPDDVTLLFADDNWGNIRRLPKPGSERAGGYGAYYHFDYVGGPRNYKWLNTTQIERTWEQMRLVHQAGADRLWIVNVGDLKPMEAPIDFFLDQAWDPRAMTVERMDDWAADWSTAQFGRPLGPAIGELIETYTRYNSRRKPELIGPDTFSLVHDREAERVLAEWTALAERADQVRSLLTTDQDDAFVQLAWFPIQASANLTRLHIATGRQRLYAAQGRPGATQAAADAVRALFARDAELTALYHALGDGKWDHMMDQTHISYTYWQQPERDVLPELAEVAVVSGTELGVAIEGSDTAWSGQATTAPLPPLDRFGARSRWIELFDRGDAAATFSATSDQHWLSISSRDGAAGETTRVEVSADWAAAPAGRSEGRVTITGSDGSVIAVPVTIENRSAPASGRFVEAEGHVAIEAANASRRIGSETVSWQTVPGLGRSGSALTTTVSDMVDLTPGGEGPRLEYDVHLWAAGEVEVQLWLSPTLDFRGRGGLRYAISIDDGPLRIVTLDLDAADTGSNAAWDKAVAANIAITASRHSVSAPGPHTIKVWLVDTGLVFQRLVVATRPLPATYLGPDESFRTSEAKP